MRIDRFEPLNPNETFSTFNESDSNYNHARSHLVQGERRKIQLAFKSRPLLPELVSQGCYCAKKEGYVGEIGLAQNKRPSISVFVYALS